MKAAFVLATSLTVSWAVAQSAKSGLSLDSMDRSVKIHSPADIPKMANGEWLKKAVMPPDRSWIGTFDSINENNRRILHEVLDVAAASHLPPDTSRGRVGLLYRVAVDEDRANRLGTRPIEDELDEVAAIRSRHDLARVIGDLQAKLGYVGGSASEPAFGFGIAQDDLNRDRVLPFLSQGGQLLPDRETYWNKSGLKLRAAYLAAGSVLLRKYGASSPMKDAEASLNLETKFAEASKTPQALRDLAANYHLMSWRQLQALAPKFDWEAYRAAAGIPANTPINVQQPRFFIRLGQLVSRESIESWKAYLRMQVAYAMSPYLDALSARTQFGLISALRGQKQMEVRWKRALIAVDSSIGEDLGQLYVAKAFPPEAKVQCRKLVQNILDALRSQIPTLEWMGDATKKKALRKLSLFTVKVGYPDKWRDYSRLHLKGDSWAADMRRASDFEWKRQIAKIGKPVDRKEWFMTPPTVDAYYDWYTNSINFPAGILQPGFYDPSADDAANYGAIGTIIGHEISHGFDDQGSQFDGLGERENWWTERDKRSFQKAGQTIVDQYSKLTNRNGEKVNGRLTLGENIADIGGNRLAYIAYNLSLGGKKAPVIDGFTGDQRFFLGYVQAWRSLMRKELASKHIATDVHAPDNLRAYVPISDNPALYPAFGLIAPKVLPHIW